MDKIREIEKETRKHFLQPDDYRDMWVVLFDYGLAEEVRINKEFEKKGDEK